jgi:hypothetical protein
LDLVNSLTICPGFGQWACRPFESSGTGLALLVISVKIKAVPRLFHSILLVLVASALPASADTFVRQTQFPGMWIATPPQSTGPIQGLIGSPAPNPPPPADPGNQQALDMLKQMLSRMSGAGTPAKIPKDADHDTYPYDSEGSEGATIGDMSAPTAGQCGSAQNLWEAAGNVTKENVIPAGSGYNMGAPNWPKLVKSGERFEVDFGPGKQSMCTSATAAAFYQHLADLANRGELQLDTRELNFLNTSRVAHNAFNGNTYSAALFYSYLGGRSIVGTRGAGDIRSKLEQAKPGDILKFDRVSGTGHSTVFKGIEGDKFCYWSSNTRTRGPGVQCESISSLVDVSISRFPADPDKIPERLDAMMNNNNLKSLLASGNGSIPAAKVGFVDELECKSPSMGNDVKSGNGKATK